LYHTNGCATERKNPTEMWTEKGIVQQRKKNQLKNKVTNNKLSEGKFTLQINCEPTSMALGLF